MRQGVIPWCVPRCEHPCSTAPWWRSRGRRWRLHADTTVQTTYTTPDQLNTNRHAATPWLSDMNSLSHPIIEPNEVHNRLKLRRNLTGSFQFIGNFLYQKYSWDQGQMLLKFNHFTPNYSNFWCVLFQFFLRGHIKTHTETDKLTTVLSSIPRAHIKYI